MKSKILLSKRLNFAYLIVPGCNNYFYDYGLDMLNKSILSLRKYLPNSNIYVYYGYDTSSKNKIKDIENYLDSMNVNKKEIGLLKHNFPKIENENLAKKMRNPYRLNILVEKIYILRDHSLEEEIIFVDLDTEFTSQVENLRLKNLPILWTEEYMLLKNRNLDNFFKKINYHVDNHCKMYNTGFIYIPSEKRRSISQEALDLLFIMNQESDKLRKAKDLDEQICLSIIISKHYKIINFANYFLKHYWGRHMIK